MEQLPNAILLRFLRPVYLEGYEDWPVSVVIVIESVCTISVQLQPLGPIYGHG